MTTAGAGAGAGAGADATATTATTAAATAATPPDEDAPEPSFFPCARLLPPSTHNCTRTSGAAVYDLTAVVHHIGGALKSGHYVTDTRGALTLDSPADLGLNGASVAARAADVDDPYGVLRRLGVLGEADGFSQDHVKAETDSDPAWAARVDALAPDRPWYRHDDSSIRRVSAFDVFGKEAQRTAYIFVFTLRE